MKGWGTVRRRNSGFQVDIYLGPERILRSYPTRALADEVLRELRRKKAMGEVGSPVTGLDPTVDAVADRLLIAYRSAQVSPATVATYTRQLSRIRAKWGQVHISSITTDAVAEWLAELADEGMAPNSIRVLADRLDAIGAWAVENAGLARAPWKIRRPPRQRGGDAISEGDYAKLLSVSNGQDRLAFLLGGDCGLRAIELIRLRGSDVSVEGRVLAVHGKGNKVRVSPIVTARLAHALLDCPPGPVLGVRTRHELDELGRPAWLTVFPNSPRRGGPRWHALRRRYATKSLGVSALPLDDLRKALGHADLQTTMIYNRARPLPIPAEWSLALEGES